MVYLVYNRIFGGVSSSAMEWVEVGVLCVLLLAVIV